MQSEHVLIFVLLSSSFSLPSRSQTASFDATQETATIRPRISSKTIDSTQTSISDHDTDPGTSHYGTTTDEEDHNNTIHKSETISLLESEYKPEEGSNKSQSSLENHGEGYQGNKKKDSHENDYQPTGELGKKTKDGGHKDRSQHGGHADESAGGEHGSELEGGGHGGEHEGVHGHRLDCSCECREVEGHHAGHKIIWPSMAGMMAFIVASGFLFYHFYTRHQMKSIMVDEKDHITFFKEAVVASTVAGIAAPGILGFYRSMKKRRKHLSTTSQKSAS